MNIFNHLRTILCPALLIMATACEPAGNDETFTGYVEEELVYVAAPQSGWIVAMPSREGDHITRNTVLFELDTGYQRAARMEAAERLAQAGAEARNLKTGAREQEISALEARLREALATLKLAKTELARWTELAERAVAPEARRDQAIASEQKAAARVQRITWEIKVAELPGREAEREAADAKREAAAAALDQAEWSLSERKVSARRDGRIEEKFYRQGEYVTAGAPVLAMLPPDALKVRFFVPQSKISRFAVGDRVLVTVDASPAPLSAKVSFIAREAEFTPPVIYSAASREKLVFLVEARLADSSALRPGQPVDVRLPQGKGR